MVAQRRGFGTFWLIVGDHYGDRPEVFELEVGQGTRALPVFGFEEEAMLFLRLSCLEGRWRVSETDSADLSSALTGAYSGVQRIVLDPFPEVGFDGSYEASSLLRERFVDLLANSRRPRSHPPNHPAATE